MMDSLSSFSFPPVSRDKVCSVGFKGCSAELTPSPLPLKTVMHMYEVLLKEEGKWNRDRQPARSAHPLTLCTVQRGWQEADRWAENAKMAVSADPPS